MRTILFPALIALVGASTACERGDRDDGPAATAVREPPSPPPPTEAPSRPDTTSDLDLDLETEWRQFSRGIEDRADRLGAKIDELERRGDARSRELAAELREKRDEARQQLAELGDHARNDWKAFKREVEDTWDRLEAEASEATR